MLMNKQQTCSFLGWTAYEFYKAAAKGFPAKKRNSSRGQDWQVDSREAVAWVVEQETVKVRPRGRPTGEPEPPPGWEAFKAVEAVADPVLGATMVTMLWAFYSVPRLTALAGSEVGLSVEQSFRMSGGVLLMLLELCRSRLEWWPKDPDASVLGDEYFEPINWPWLAEKAGEPGWTPPKHILGWVEMAAEERAGNARHGREQEARWAEQEAAASAGAT